MCVRMMVPAQITMCFGNTAFETKKTEQEVNKEGSLKLKEVKLINNIHKTFNNIFFFIQRTYMYDIFSMTGSLYCKMSHQFSNDAALGLIQYFSFLNPCFNDTNKTYNSRDVQRINKTVQI